MTENKRETIQEENEYRKSVRRTLLTVGTPLLTVVVLGLIMAVSTIVSTFFAAQKFEEVTNINELNEVIADINFSSYTSPFVEGYKAKYNYATAIGVAQPQNAVNLYAQEILPISPPEFICYPVTNGMYYSNILGDAAMEIQNYLEAEHYYNYSEYFMTAAPHCFNGGGSSGEEGDSESGADDSEEEPQEGEAESDETGEQSEQFKQMQEDIKNKQNQAREAQGKETDQGDSEGDRPTEQQQEQNEQRSEESKQSQRSTEELRDTEKNQNPTVNSETPW